MRITAALLIKLWLMVID